MAEVCDEVEWRLKACGAPIYQRGGRLVRVVDEASRIVGLKRDPAAPRIVLIDDLNLIDIASRHVEFWRRNRKTGRLVRSDCPRAVAQTILARREWDFPVLEAVVEHPIMLADGRVLWESQYEPTTGILLQLQPDTFQSPLSHASEYEVQSALDLLRSLLAGFEFVDDVDESVALALLLTSFVRPILPTCPAFAATAHAPGSGKSYLIRIASRMSTGRDPAFMTFRDDPAELNKLIFAALLEGDQQIAIDNVDMPVSGADLAVILTSPMFRGRVLGQSSTASVPTKAVLTFNGNNLQIVGDLTRRVLVARLDPACERPAERDFTFDPVREVTEQRSEYVDAAITIMAAYIQSHERVSLRPFGSFEEWSRLVREPLVWLGLPDPVESIRELEAADPERTQLVAMLQAVHRAFGQAEFKAADLLAATKSKGQPSIEGAAGMPAEATAALQDALQAVCERNGEFNVKALGRWLLRFCGRIDGGMRFERVRTLYGAAVWRVDRVQ